MSLEGMPALTFTWQVTLTLVNVPPFPLATEEAQILGTDGTVVRYADGAFAGTYTSPTISSSDSLGWGFYTQELPFGDVINIVFTQSLAEAGFSFPSANDTQLVTALDYPNDRNWHMFLTFHYDTGETYADPQSSLSGDSGADTLEGTQFRDELLGLAGKDTLTGGEGEDSLHGGAGDDLLRGGEGDDRLVGGRGDDTLWGGPGEDTFVHGAASGRDRIADFEQGDLLALRGYSVGGRDLEFQDLDTNGDGVLGDGDAPVSVNGRGDLVLHLAAFGGHRPDTITLQHIPVLDSTDLVFR